MKEFKFTLTKEEVIDYYTYLLSSTKSNRLKQLFFVLSVPSLLWLSFAFFKIENKVITSIFGIISILWIMIVAPRFWKIYTRINIGEVFLKKNNLTQLEEVRIKLYKEKLFVNKTEYDLSKDIKIVKTKLLTIFFFPTQPIAIPNRLLSDDNMNHNGN